MKKLTVQQPSHDEMPKEYKELLQVNQNKFKQPENKSLPDSHIYKRMKKLSSFKQIKRSYKLENRKDIFLNDLNELFQHLNVDEHKYDTELLLELLNASEQYFIYGSKAERELCKQEVLNEVMLPFFDYNKEVMQKFVESVSNRVKKSNVLRRLFKRLYNFFL